MRRLTSVVLTLLLILTGVLLLVEHQWGSDAGPGLEPPTSAGAAAQTASPVGGSSSTAPDLAGVPVRLEIPFASSNHPAGVVATVSSDPLTDAGDLFVPPDPRTVSWAREDAAPGASRGTAILVGHVNSVIDGELVRGALSDLAEYAVEHVGEEFAVVLDDGRELTYRITGGAQYDKDELAARPELREELYDQRSVFGPAPGSGRLVLVSCGGAFDRATGNYADNLFVFALPVGSPAVEEAARPAGMPASTD